MRHSDAINRAITPLEEALLPSPPPDSPHGIRTLMDGTLTSARQLHFTKAFLQGVASDPETLKLFHRHFCCRRRGIRARGRDPRHRGLVPI